VERCAVEALTTREAGRLKRQEEATMEHLSKGT
jgi:hypothetical protein